MVTAAGVREDLTLGVDGDRPVTRAVVDAVQALCARAEDHGGTALVTLYLTGSPRGDWTSGLDVAAVTKWERALRRLERLTAPTAAVVSGDAGGPALDALLATDFRIARPGTRLIVAGDGEATWPGMSLYRLARQAGVGRIRRAALLGVPIGTADALALGLVDEVADDPDAALTALTALAATAAGPELAIRRQLLFDADRTSFEDALGSHLAACDRAVRRGAGS